MTPTPASDASAPNGVSDAHRRAGIAAHAADEKKGEDIRVLDVGDIISIAEAFVFVSASNSRLVRTIVDEIELALKLSDDEGPRSVEGLDDASWVGFRLAELLPLEQTEKQHLLQMVDPLQRLARLQHHLPRFQRD